MSAVPKEYNTTEKDTTMTGREEIPIIVTLWQWI